MAAPVPPTNPIPDTLQQPERPAETARWNGWWGTVYTLIVFLVSQVVAGLIISIYPTLKGWSQGRASSWLDASVFAQFVFILLAEGLAIGGVYLFLRSHKAGWRDIKFKKPRWIDVAYALAAVVPYYVLYAVLVTLASKYVPGFNADQKQEIGFSDVHGSLQLLLTFVSLAVLPPLAEEIMVRGLLYTSLKKVVPLGWAVVVTSALFASAHLGEGGAAGPLYVAALDTFILSLVLIYLREKTDSLWAGIFLHGIKNSIAFVALFLVK